MNFLIPPYIKHDLSMPEFSGLKESLDQYSSSFDLKSDKQMLEWGFLPQQTRPYDINVSEEIRQMTISDETLHEIMNKYKEVDVNCYTDIPEQDKQIILEQKLMVMPFTFGKANLVHITKANSHLIRIQEEMQKLVSGLKVTAQTGSFWYPEKGYMGWHTNENHTGFRVYCAYSFKERSSFFKYRNPDTGEIVTCWDDVGWNVRVFKVGRTPKDRLWHCVYSNTDRISIGFSVE